MNPQHLFADLRRRNIYKVAVAYGVVSWLLIQITTQVFPVFEIPAWGARLVIVVLALGFPIAVVLAWNGRDDTLACLDSLRGIQTVCVDNGSTDGTADVVRAEHPTTPKPGPK